MTAAVIELAVAVGPSLSCFECHYCRTGHNNLCERWAALGVTHPAPPPSSWPPLSPTARSCPTACAGKIQIQPGPASS